MAHLHVAGAWLGVTGGVGAGYSLSAPLLGAGKCLAGFTLFGDFGD